ncbi:MAG TPA: OadG family protein [Firmicutes bacterium]|jgi:sodium pump decarboxylase gamma subunit|nr:OadG family protein [Bacillota bacterium]
MIPDTLAGGLMLTVINMVVVFAALTVIAFVINLIHRLTSKEEDEKPNAGTGLGSSNSQGASRRAEKEVLAAVAVPFDSLDSRRKAAIMAALRAYLGYDAVPVFVRRIPDAGAWGKTSRIHALK